MLNMLYNKGIEGKDIWEEVSRFFGKPKNKMQHMNVKRFYNDKFGLLIDLCSMVDQAMHGSGTHLVNSTGVLLDLSGIGIRWQKMDPGNIPLNVLVVRPMNLGKLRFVVDQLYGPVRGKFDYIVLICPTFVHKKIFERISKKDLHKFVMICEQHEVEMWLMVAR